MPKTKESNRQFSEHHAKSLVQFLEIVLEIRRSWASRSSFIDPWFRGQGDASYALLPGFYRIPKEDAPDEDDLRADFQLKARPFITGGLPDDEWAWYFVMQHHGLPTRLLDWSSSAMTALYFAVSSSKGKCDAAVWMLDPWKLNKTNVRRDEVLFCTDKMARRYLVPPFEKDRMPKYPAAVEPPRHFARITAQRGLFTVHGTSRQPIEMSFQSSAKPHLAKIVVPRKNVNSLRQDLRIAGVTETSIYPDLDGLSREIRMEWIDDNY